MLKIKRILFQKKKLFLIFLGFILLYTRLINLSWGLPLPMHPDERNIALSVQQLNCYFGSNFSLKMCLHPHFFAYGQFMIYLAYLISWFINLFLPKEIDFYTKAVISLRLISALSSIINVFVIYKIIKIFLKKESNFTLLLSFLIIIFSPYAIQFAHFGTTESLLMLFYSLIIYFSLLYLNKKINQQKFLLLSAFFCGLALATKISAVIFLIVPILSLVLSEKFFLSLFKNIFWFLSFIGLSALISIIFSPHNLISWPEFINAIRYESDVALGRLPVFYTRQFVKTIPIWFQIVKIFPYAIGPFWWFSLIYLLFSNWQSKKVLILRLSFFIYFLSNSFFFVKWTRFMAPVFPLITIFMILTLTKIKKNFIKILLTFLVILPGIAYLSIYQNSDIRIKVSKWFNKNVTNNAYILSETANVIDIPIILNDKKNFQIVSFDFYNLDQNKKLQEELKLHLALADYIVIPSSRVIANHYCNENNNYFFDGYWPDRCQFLIKTYPLVNQYYKNLFNGKMNFRQIAIFESYPKIEINFFWLKKKFVFFDNKAEETWRVFDHPVILIFKKIKNHD